MATVVSRTQERYRAVARSLAFFIVVHVAALGTMAFLLEPGLRPTVTVGERAAYVAAHPWAWRLGWFPWQLCALSNLLMSATLTRWLSSRPSSAGSHWALLSLFLTVAAIVPEQWGELVLVKDYVNLARGVGDEAGLRAFAETERWVFVMTGPAANTSYVLMTIAWIMALRRAAGAVLARNMTLLGVCMCVPFLAASALIYRATRTLELRGMEQSIPFNAIAFPLLLLWALFTAVLLQRMHRRDFPHADEALHRAQPAWLAWICDLRDVMRPMPFVELRSDVTDVVFLNWLVPAERAQRLLPAGLELGCIGGRAAISVLTYTHGSFGPSAAGPLRKLLPSPRQSNWRLYVRDRGSVYFVKAVLSSWVYTIGARVLSDGLPAHRAAKFEHGWADGEIRTVIVPGNSHAPDLRSTARPTADRSLPGAWSEAFDNYDGALQYLIEQNRAVMPMPSMAAMVVSNIDIPIALSAVQPAACTVQSAWLEDLVEGCAPLCFIVPAVPFRALGEVRLPIVPAPHSDA